MVPINHLCGNKFNKNSDKAPNSRHYIFTQIMNGDPHKRAAILLYIRFRFILHISIEKVAMLEIFYGNFDKK